MSKFPHTSQRYSGRAWRTFALVLTSLALTVGGGVSVASADPAPPPTGDVYGLAASDATGSPMDGVGLRGGFTPNPQTMISYVATGDAAGPAEDPIAIQPAPPYTDSTGWRIGAYYQSLCSSVAYPGCFYTGRSLAFGNSSFQSTVTNYECGSAEYAPLGDFNSGGFLGYRSVSQYTLTQDPYNSDGNTSADPTGFSASSCPFLQSYDLTITHYSISGVGVTTTFHWDAYLASRTDGSNLYTGIRNPESAICNDDAQDNVAIADGITAGACDAYVIPDPETAASCGPQPVFNPFDATTYDQFGPFMLYWPQCWFVPKGTIDPNGVMAASWNDSGIGELITDVSGIGTRLAIPEGCGNLLGAGTTPLGPSFSLNTCSWSSVGAPLKTVLSVAVSIFSAWLLITWVIKIVLLVLGPKVGPTPEGENTDEVWSVS